MDNREKMRKLEDDSRRLRIQIIEISESKTREKRGKKNIN